MTQCGTNLVHRGFRDGFGELDAVDLSAEGWVEGDAFDRLGSESEGGVRSLNLGLGLGLSDRHGGGRMTIERVSSWWGKG